MSATNKNGLWCQTHGQHITDPATHNNCTIYSSCGGSCGDAAHKPAASQSKRQAQLRRRGRSA